MTTTLPSARIDELLAALGSSKRVETGPLRFGDDWAGIFMRGDGAFHAAMSIGRAAREVSDTMLQVTLTGEAKLLASCKEPAEAFDLPSLEELRALIAEVKAGRETIAGLERQLLQFMEAHHAETLKEMERKRK